MGGIRDRFELIVFVLFELMVKLISSVEIVVILITDFALVAHTVCDEN